MTLGIETSQGNLRGEEGMREDREEAKTVWSGGGCCKSC